MRTREDSAAYPGTVRDMLVSHPAEMEKHMDAGRRLDRDLATPGGKEPRENSQPRKRLDEIKKRQIEKVRAWVELQKAEGRIPVAPTLGQVEDAIREMVKRYMTAHLDE